MKEVFNEGDRVLTITFEELYSKFMSDKQKDHYQKWSPLPYVPIAMPYNGVTKIWDVSGSRYSMDRVISGDDPYIRKVNNYSSNFNVNPQMCMGFRKSKTKTETLKRFVDTIFGMHLFLKSQGKNLILTTHEVMDVRDEKNNDRTWVVDIQGLNYHNLTWLLNWHSELDNSGWYSIAWANSDFLLGKYPRVKENDDAMPSVDFYMRHNNCKSDTVIPSDYENQIIEKYKGVK